MFLAWRCLYAEFTRARIDKGNPDMGAALERTGAMSSDVHHKTVMTYLFRRVLAHEMV